MRCKLLGFQEMDFTTDKGDQIQGAKIHIGYPMDGVKGLFTSNHFVRSELILGTNLKDGGMYNVEFVPTPSGKSKLVSFEEAQAQQPQQK
jgi:hypothetical protein